MDGGHRKAVPVGEGRIEDIEVLRAVAVLIVIIQHMQFNLLTWQTPLLGLGRLWHGAVGVDLFFTISGFVITRNILPRLEVAGGGLPFLATTLTFLLRRFWRLQPSAWLWIVLPVVLGLFFNETGAFHSFRANLAGALSAVLAFNNIRFGVVFGSGDLGVNFPYWSLSFEEQFYIALPVLILLFRKRLVYLMLALVAYQFVVPLGPIFFGTRPGPIAMGVLLAIWSEHPAYGLAEPRYLGRSAVLRGAFLFAVVAFAGMLQSELPQPLLSVPYGIVGLLGGIVVYAASFDRGYIMKAGLLKRCAVWIGARSYALYLIHIPAFSMTRALFAWLLPPTPLGSPHLTLAYVVTAGAIMVLLSDLNFRYIEVPGRRYGKSLRIAVPAPA